MRPLASGKFQRSKKKVRWKFRTGESLKSCLTFSFLPACVPLIKCIQNPSEGFRCVLLGGGSCSLPVLGAIEPPCPNSSVSHPHHPQSPGWQGQAMKFKELPTTLPPTPDLCPQLALKQALRPSWGHQWCQPWIHSIPPSPDLSWPLSSHTLGI